MTRKTRRPCRNRLRARLRLSHATVLFGFPRQVSDRLRGLLLSTPPFSERYLTSAYAAHDQVVAVSHLDRMRQGAFDGIRIATGSVSADGFHFLVILQPGQDRFHMGVWQEIEWLAGLKIEHQCSVAVPAP